MIWKRLFYMEPSNYLRYKSGVQSQQKCIVKERCAQRVFWGAPSSPTLTADATGGREGILHRNVGK